MANNSSLPLDVIEEIIDALTTLDPGNRHFSTIKSFSLVCRGTLPMSRKNLFALVILNNRGHAQHTNNSFYKMLTECPELAQYIRKLVFHVDPIDCLAPPEMFLIFKQLTNLRSLALYGQWEKFRWTLPFHRQALLPLLHLPTITRLKLHGIIDFLVSDLIPCVGLENLDFAYSSCGVSDENLPTAISPGFHSIAIQSLVCTWRHKDHDPLLALYRTRGPDGKRIIDFSKLRRLSITSIDCVNLHSLEDLFFSCHQIIRINLDFLSRSSTLGGLFNVVQGSLQTLRHLSMLFAVDHSMQFVPFDFLQEMEKMNSRNVLETLNIKILVKTRNCPPGDAAAWGDLDRMFISDGFTALRRVSIIVMPGTPLVVFDASLEPKLLAQFQGLLSSPTVAFNLEINRLC